MRGSGKLKVLTKDNNSNVDDLAAAAKEAAANYKSFTENKAGPGKIFDKLLFGE